MLSRYGAQDWNRTSTRKKADQALNLSDGDRKGVIRRYLAELPLWTTLPFSAVRDEVPAESQHIADTGISSLGQAVR